MPLISDLIHHPRRLSLRKIFFQVHLWAGILLSIYVVVIALSGAILVFEGELTAMLLPPGMHAYEPSHLATLSQVAAHFQRELPRERLSLIVVPTAEIPVFRLSASDSTGRFHQIIADPVTAELRLCSDSWLTWVHNLHLYLLLPPSTGVKANGVGAGILLLVSITGLALWWPGVRSWLRGFRLNLRANWRRINFDLHNAIGIWSLFIVLWWALSGVYFGFYKQVSALVNLVSPVHNMAVPPALPASNGEQHLALPVLLRAAQAASPSGHLYSLSDPLLLGPSVYVDMDLERPGDFSHRDIVLLDTSSGKVLSIWHYARKDTLGDWILWSMHPLHFGTLWGTAIKVIWSTLAVGLALLSITGLLMYWNRYLRHL